MCRSPLAPPGELDLPHLVPTTAEVPQPRPCCNSKSSENAHDLPESDVTPVQSCNSAKDSDEYFRPASRAKQTSPCADGCCGSDGDENSSGTESPGSACCSGCYSCTNPDEAPITPTRSAYGDCCADDDHQSDKDDPSTPPPEHRGGGHCEIASLYDTATFGRPELTTSFGGDCCTSSDPVGDQSTSPKALACDGCCSDESCSVDQGTQTDLTAIIASDPAHVVFQANPQTVAAFEGAATDGPHCCTPDLHRSPCCGKSYDQAAAASDNATPNRTPCCKPVSPRPPWCGPNRHQTVTALADATANGSPCCESEAPRSPCCDEEHKTSSKEKYCTKANRSRSYRKMSCCPAAGSVGIDVRTSLNLLLEDAEACKCCIKTMFEQPNFEALSALLNRAQDISAAIRRCCTALAGLCCPVAPNGDNPCCTGEASCETADYMTSTAGQARPPPAKCAPLGDEDMGGRQTFSFTVSGMDCPDCLKKIKRAATRLDSVDVLALDYARGAGRISCNVEIITPDAICRFMSSLTGFKIDPVAFECASSLEASFILPIDLRCLPSLDVLGRYETAAVQQRRDRTRVDFVIRPGKVDSLLPRVLLSQLTSYEPHLVDQDDDVRSRIRGDLLRLVFRTSACAIFTIPILVLVWAPLPDHGQQAYHAAELVLATAVVILAWPMYRSTLSSFWYLREADLGLLAALSTLTAYVFSLVAFAFDVSGHYFADPLFETVGLLITLIYVGRTVQSTTRLMTSMALSSLTRLQPSSALLLRNGDDKEFEPTEIDARLLHYGDTIRICEGGVVPTEGLVIAGDAEADESSTTGESAPVLKSVGQVVTAGATLVHGQIDVCVSRLVHENSLSSIRAAVQASQNSDSRASDIADRFAGILLPIASAAAIVAWIVWMLVSRFVRHESWGVSVSVGVQYAIAVLAVSCPCALGLAVSAVTSISVACALREGILFRSAEAFHRIGSVDLIAFDKTGTLSQNALEVVRAEVGSALAVKLVADFTSSSKHPVATAVHHSAISSAMSRTLDGAPLQDVNVIPGSGIQATLFDLTLRGGNAIFTAAIHLPSVQSMLDDGLTVFVVTLGDQLIAAYGLHDCERDSARPLVKDLRSRGKRVVLLSGDNPDAVNRFAGNLGIPLPMVYGGCTPADKARILLDFKVGNAPSTPSGKRHAVVAFVGDGTNDSLALSTADVSVSLGTGTDVAISSSQVVLFGSDLRRMLHAAFQWGRLTHWHVIASLAWCGFYFAFAILLAAGAFVRFQIPAAYAGFGEVVSVAPVILIAFHVGIARRVEVWWQRCNGKYT